MMIRRRPARTQNLCALLESYLSRTLHMYIGRELAKVTLLALVSFTLVMTVFAIIEPLRKKGLAADQVLALVTFTLPVMLSFTLPVASLFAATIVYGRFAQDNELLACRASGISTLSLLKPAFALGALVTVASMFLSNYVTPEMARGVEQAIKGRAKSIVSHQLAGQGYFKFENHLIHADGVEQQGDLLRLRGVVYADIAKADNITFVTAGAATVQFDTYGSETFATVELDHPVITRTGDPSTGMEALQRPLESLPVPSPFKEKASFFDWRKLLEGIEKPTQFEEIQKNLSSIMLAIRHDRFANDLIKSFDAPGGQYDRLKDRDHSYVIKAASAAIKPGTSSRTGSVTIALAGSEAEGTLQQVEVVVTQGGKPCQIITAESGLVTAAWSSRQDLSQVSIELRDRSGVRMRAPGESPQEAIRRSGWSVGQLTIPAEILAAADQIPMNEVYANPRGFTSNASILKRLKDLRTTVLNKFVGELTGELHQRVAYSVSCFLMVALGAALGLIYRGGQVVSAFAICAVPASIVIVMMIMGKQLVSNTDVQAKYGAYGMVPGLAAIWSGIVVLGAANIVIYARLARK